MSLILIHIVAQATDRLGTVFHTYTNHVDADAAYVENKRFGDEHNWITARFDMLMPATLHPAMRDAVVGQFIRTEWYVPFKSVKAIVVDNIGPGLHTDKPVYDDTEVRIGMRVRSYDFPESSRAASRACYTEGVVRGVEDHHGCLRYEVEIEKTCWQGIVQDGSDCDSQYVYPPVNGQPMTFGGVTRGVVPEHLWMD